MKDHDVSALRTEYVRATLDEAHVSAEPLTQFARWFDDAVQAQVNEPSAMILATTTLEGHPSSRVVLLKGVDSGFVFFTNYESQKGQELSANPYAALLFFWPELERQIRIQGSVTRLSEAESTEYFLSRPHESQLGAWTSHQSTVIASRNELDNRFTALTNQYAVGAVPKPPYWGGFRVLPTSVEFWQGRANRLHDRLRYRQLENTWVVERLSP